MSKNKWVIVIALLLIFLFAACGDQGETPEQAVTNALTAIRDYDIETAQKYFDYEDLMGAETEELTAGEEIAKLLFDNLTFKVVSSSAEGETATVTTEITNTNLGYLLSEYFDEALSLAFENAFAGEDAKSEEEMEEEMDQLFADLLKKEDNETLTSTVDINLNKSDTGWKINIDEKFQDALSGGLSSAVEDLNEGFNRQ